ncbi:MAG: hypothetical protein J4473_04605 [Candidatus Aenigmarchaeota archaeon]|nr:hypothetical protein [Candidatus Aenigmarchaeota archaeon]
MARESHKKKEATTEHEIAATANIPEKAHTTEKSHNPMVYALIIIVLSLLVYNQFAISGLSAKITDRATSPAVSSISSGNSIDVVPRGKPAIYGDEIGLSYDDVSPNNPQLADVTIRKLSSYDEQIKLEGADLQRYIKIVSQISCEYCCGADSIIFSDGKPACGCAHSYSMRGLAKYLITKHPNEYTDDQILEELGKWKTLFFPTQIAQKAEILKSKGIELNYINMASNKYRGIESGSTSGKMVGGC